ncbi:hypothetical protein HHE94_14140 [Pseudoalteromonas arctica]|uniref:Uncharacterized protein n=2 Tax=Pseudoalteromonas arctica TaxID=394751 RepID=A0AAP7CLS2_9GAMM|nr:hypothetical protein [Pseudoalteromonas arctica]NMP03843.1 hypothetical protein [Pseudoalteromonas arctica]
MTVEYIHQINIADTDSDCVLNLKLPTLGGRQECIIPFGNAATQKKENPKPSIEIPHTVALNLFVFKDPSLDKAKAGVPEFVPLFKGIDKLGKNDAIGYFYVFINGFLWREVASLPQGALSEVDLRIHHDKNFRPFSSAESYELVVPSRAVGLFSSSTSADIPNLQIAFSRVQWSWDYINKLGGMWPKDPRFDIAPQRSQCINATLAEELRSKRMQKIDLGNAPNWSQIKNAGKTNNNSPCIFVHDILGITQTQKLNADYELKLLKEHQANLQSNPFYKSAMLAHQLFRNEELWKTQLISTPAASYNEYYKTDEQSKFARDAGRHLSPKELEKYLIGTNPDWLIARLDSYIESRKRLQNMHNLYCEDLELPLSDICTRNNVEAPPSWESLLCDLTTLSACAYPFAFEFCHEQLASLMLPNTLIPAFIPALTNVDAKGRTSEELVELFIKGKAYNEQLVSDDSSWFNVQFCPNDGLYGDDLGESSPIEEKIGKEIGAFDPFKLSELALKADLQGSTMPSLFVEIRTLAAFEKILAEAFMYWERVFKERTFAGREPDLFYARVGSLAKSFDIEPLKDIKLHDMNAVPSDRVVISMSFVRHTLIEKIQSSTGRKALKNALTSIKKGKPVNNNQLITIARELQMNINSEGAAQFKAQKGQPYMLKQVRAEVLRMLNEVNDINGTFKTITGVVGKVFTAPLNKMPTSTIYEYNRDLDPAIATKMLTPNNAGKAWFEVKRGASIGLLALTGITAYYAYAQYESEFEGKGETYQFAKHVAILGSVVASVGSVWENYSQAAGTSSLTKERLKDFAKDLSKSKKRLVKFTYLRTFGGVMGVLMSGVQMADAVEMWNKHDKDAATVNAVAGLMGAAAAIYGAVFASMGPIGWGLFLGSLLLSIVAVALIDSSAEKWCKFGPFAENKKGIWLGELDADYNNFSNPEIYHKFIMSVLYSPKAQTTAISPTQFLVKVSLPVFLKSTSELSLEFKYKLKYKMDHDYTQGNWQNDNILGNREYEATYNESGNLIQADYLIDVDDTTLSFMKKIGDTAAIPTLSYDSNLTMPFDYDAIIKPVHNPTYPNPWVVQE